MSLRTLVKKLIPRSLFIAIEPYGHLVESVILNTLNGFPARGIKVIGVTGTNGKTSTCFMIHKMLQEAGYKTGLTSTVAWGVGEDIQPQIQHWTNVPVKELMKRLKVMKKAKVDWLIMETTSQALAQNRVWGVKYSVAVLTNMSHEHLDYHRTFENYVLAKRKMFKLANANKRGLRVGVINAEDVTADAFTRDIKNPILYGINKGDLRAEQVSLTPSGSTYSVKYNGEEYKIKCRIPGTFNVYNSLAAVGVGVALGLTKSQIENGIAALESVSGRMTRIDESQNFDVIVDFAHSPDSFEKLFKDIKPITKGRLIVMFGSPGRRDMAKGPKQGDLAGKYADLIILTEEDDRDADGIEILNNIAAAVKKHGKVESKDLFLIHDRTEAITFTLKQAKAGDTVLLLGKGHEHTMETAKGVVPWDEVTTAHKALKAIKISQT